MNHYHLLHIHYLNNFPASQEKLIIIFLLLRRKMENRSNWFNRFAGDSKKLLLRSNQRKLINVFFQLFLLRRNNRSIFRKNLRFFGGFNKLDFGHLSSSIQKFSKMKEIFSLILFADYGLSQLFSVGFDTPVAQGLIDSL